jgi:hypothetical protein
MDIPGFSRELGALRVPHTLRIVGEGPLRAELEEAMAGRAEFTGRLDIDGLYQRIYPELDVLLLFSESEAFGIALVEGLQHGVVPVSSRFVGHAAEGIVRHGETALLFAVGDVAEAAHHVQRLALDADRLEGLSTRGRAFVAGRYTWAASVAGWSTCLEEILTLPPRLGSGHRPALSASGRLESLGVPEPIIDALRRARVRVAGVPSALRGGEEWPWIGRHHQPSALQEIEERSRELDVARPAMATSGGPAGA